MKYDVNYYDNFWLTSSMSTQFIARWQLIIAEHLFNRKKNIEQFSIGFLITVEYLKYVGLFWKFKPITLYCLIKIKQNISHIYRVIEMKIAFYEKEETDLVHASTKHGF